MAASVEIGGIAAVVADGVWSCGDAVMLRYLRTVEHGYGGPSAAEPNPDLTLARDAAELFGGRVVAHDELPREPGRIY